MNHREQTKATTATTARASLPFLSLAVSLLAACGAGAADEPMSFAGGAASPAQAAPHALRLSATDLPAPAATPPAPLPTTAPTPAASAVDAPAYRHAARTASLPAAAAGAAPLAQYGLPTPMPLSPDGEGSQTTVVVCAMPAGGETTVPLAGPLASLPQCPAGDAFPPASSPSIVSAELVVVPTASRDAGVSLPPR